MSPDFAGRDLIAVLDWAEDLEGLRQRANGAMMLGSYSDSYDEWLLAGAGRQQRLHVIAPDIAPYDLTYSLDPHDVIKAGWVLALVGGGDPTVVLDAIQERGGGLRQDPIIHESVARGALSKHFPDAAYNPCHYHSPRYFCENQPAGSQAAS